VCFYQLLSINFLSSLILNHHKHIESIERCTAAMSVFYQMFAGGTEGAQRQAAG
jgi:hypothetical protein